MTHLLVQEATREGHRQDFTLTEKMKYTKGTSAATTADLKEGVRVSVYVENDGKTATAVKIAN